MKRFLKWVVVLAVLTLFAQTAQAAGTVTVAETTGGIGKTARQLVYTVTFGADASRPTAVALDNILTTAGERVASVAEWWLFKVSVYYGATGPKDNTDFFIYREQGGATDLMGGNGMNAIDNATNTLNIYPATSTQQLYGTDKLTFSTENDVNNAVCTLVVELYK